MHRILIVGGGAAGIELATNVGDRLGTRGYAQVELLDRSRTHLWKPQLHEIASGSMDLGTHELDYAAQARQHHFRYFDTLTEMLAGRTAPRVKLH